MAELNTFPVKSGSHMTPVSVSETQPRFERAKTGKGKLMPVVGFLLVVAKTS